VDFLREPAVLVVVAVSGLWYLRGSRRTKLHAVGRPPRRDIPWRAICFAAALVSLVLALDSPLDRLAATRFWAHMLQHVVLIGVVAPLIVLGAPWLPFWRALPLRIRSSLGRIRPGVAWAAAPIAAWLLFDLDLGLWHIPYFYELTLRNGAVHVVEHVSFVVFGILFWAQVIDSPPHYGRLPPFARALYATAGSAASWLLALVLALATTPLYPAQHVGHGGISALADQQLAAGMMIGPGSIPYAIVVFYWLYVWLGTEEPRHKRREIRRAPLGDGSS